MLQSTASQQKNPREEVPTVTRGAALLTAAEEALWEGRSTELSNAHQADKLPYSVYWSSRQELDSAKLADVVARAQARAEEFLEGLLIIVAHHGDKGLRFDQVFTESAGDARRADLAAADTVDSRRALRAILAALAEMPDNWNDLELRRFLFATGKEGKAKFAADFRGAFKNDESWNLSELGIVAEYFAGPSHPFAAVFRRHGSSAAPEQPTVVSASDFEIVPARPEPRDERENLPIDREFVAKLLALLEQRA